MIELAIGNRKHEIAGNIRVEREPNGTALFLATFLETPYAGRSLCFIFYFPSN